MIFVSSCASGRRASEQDIRVVTKIERPVPPEALVVQCVAAANIELDSVRSLLDDRDAWKAAFCKCAAQNDRLIQWTTDKVPAELTACRLF